MAYDFGVLLVLLFCLYRGASKGVAWQVAGIGALVLCFIFATPLSSVVAPTIPLEPPLNRWVAMLGIYLFFSFATFAVARAFREILEKARFQEFDKHLGAIFGLLKGLLFSLVFTFFIVAISEKARDYVLTTHTGHYAAIIMDRLNPIMPEELHAILEPYIHTLDDAAKGKLKNQHGTRKTGELVEGDDPFGEDSEEPLANSRDLRKSFGDEEDEAGDLLNKAVGETAKRIGQETLKDVGKRVDDFFGDLTEKEQQAQKKSGYRPVQETGEEDTPIQPRKTNAQPTSTARYKYRPEDYEPLIREMSREWAKQNRVREDQARYEIEVLMQGIPKSIGAAILHDFKADLYQSEEDPDPETDARTPFKERVRRQVTGTGPTPHRLTQGMRDRLDAIEAD